jgi:hypothetical protein
MGLLDSISAIVTLSLGGGLQKKAMESFSDQEKAVAEYFL